MAYKIKNVNIIDDNTNVSSANSVTLTTLSVSNNFVIPSGTTAARPAAPPAGTLFFDTTEAKLKTFNGSDWV